ncbi:MAG: hypothetical protein F4X56_00540 [Gammaproteobacteria bacterium]|nr:hypothetical protein [Gammaproteobacteria bacterium]MYC24386.1 hypothetical protein [Gammaproteobacteria bacterium]
MIVRDRRSLQKQRHTKLKPRLHLWYWAGGIALALVMVSLALLYFSRANTGVDTPSESTDSNSDLELQRYVSQAIEVESPNMIPQPFDAPNLESSVVSLEDACGFDQFVPFHAAVLNDDFHWPHSLWDANDELASFFTESEECRTALDNHITDINPYLWGAGDNKGSFAFIELEKPLTFGRIFTDPEGDFSRVQDALDRPECILQHNSESNWALNESCHSDSIMNYALINRYCFHNGVSQRPLTHYWDSANFTLEQDRFMWKQALEGEWIEKKCAELPPDLQLSTKLNPDLIKLLVSIDNPMRLKGTVATLIELAARLGDEAAGLTQGYFIPSSSIVYLEHGSGFGRFKGIFSSRSWKELQFKKAPSVERFLQTFQLLADIRQTQTELNWDLLVQHLCKPPYDESNLTLHESEDQEQSDESHICRTVINELYVEELISGPMLEIVDQFERTAMELELIN